MAKKKARSHENRGVNDGDKEVGRRLRLTRIERGMSQDELGKALGVSFQQVQKYEKGTNRISCGRIMLIASTLKTTPHDLMGWQSLQSTVLIDVETYKLAKSFAGLKEQWKPAVRSLIAAMMRVD